MTDFALRTCLLILVPMLATFAGMRLYLHLVNPNADLFIRGYNVHHLFTGCLIAIPAAFVVAFAVVENASRRVSLAVLGIGSAMILDQVIFLITTDGSNASYLKPISLWGAVVLMAGGVIVLLALAAFSS